jgi:hypothetical protein
MFKYEHKANIFCLIIEKERLWMLFCKICCACLMNFSLLSRIPLILSKYPWRWYHLHSWCAFLEREKNNLWYFPFHFVTCGNTVIPFFFNNFPRCHKWSLVHNLAVSILSQVNSRQLEFCGCQLLSPIYFILSNKFFFMLVGAKVQ